MNMIVNLAKPKKENDRLMYSKTLYENYHCDFAKVFQDFIFLTTRGNCRLDGF